MDACPSRAGLVEFMARTIWVLGLSLLGWGLVPPAFAEGEIPCSDTSLPTMGCPDLLVDPVRMLDANKVVRNFANNHCAVVEGMTEAGTRTLLRFTFTTPNLGTGDLIVGRPADHPEWFVFSPCHNHFHFRQYADYRLWTVDGYAAWVAARLQMPTATAQQVLAAHPELEDDFLAGNKMGFCVIDIRSYTFVLGAKYQSCSQNQGISVGWADEYNQFLDGQWVDVTGVPSGRFVLEAEVNAERLYEEKDYLNNAAAIPVTI